MKKSELRQIIREILEESSINNLDDAKRAVVKAKERLQKLKQRHREVEKKRDSSKTSPARYDRYEDTLSVIEGDIRTAEDNLEAANYKVKQLSAGKRWVGGSYNSGEGEWVAKKK